MADEKTTDPPPPANTTKDDAEPSTSDAGTEEPSNILQDNFSTTEEPIKEAASSENQLPAEPGAGGATESETDSVETPSPPRASQDSTVVAEAAAAVPIQKGDQTSEDQENRRVSDNCSKVNGHPPDMERASGAPTAEGPRDSDESGRPSPPNDLCAQRLRRLTCERHYDCEECQRFCRQRAHLARHRRRYTSERLFECSECGSHFVRRGNLDRHLTIDHHRCRVCPATFADIYGLAAHVIWHSLDLM
ncbi:zinc finger protein 880-like isoform X1 [Dermacentor silvarum]|uniref:zinc finger protein 880-like isoform X1 n=1 Tax=Dermacentor silvarum TaxID=543639 RepID=UPI00189B365A|nr:zinc finger protein 880-like isoform X1 [Dermacentor silvarum]